MPSFLFTRSATRAVQIAQLITQVAAIIEPAKTTAVVTNAFTTVSTQFDAG